MTDLSRCVHIRAVVGNCQAGFMSSKSKDRPRARDRSEADAAKERKHSG